MVKSALEYFCKSTVLSPDFEGIFAFQNKDCEGEIKIYFHKKKFLTE